MVAIRVFLNCSHLAPEFVAGSPKRSHISIGEQLIYLQVKLSMVSRDFLTF